MNEVPEIQDSKNAKDLENVSSLFIISSSVLCKLFMDFSLQSIISFCVL